MPVPEPILPLEPSAGAPTRFVGWLLVERLVRALIGIVVMGVLARTLGPEGFGSINAALALVAVFMPLATLGLDILIVRDLVQKPSLPGTLLGTAVALRVGLGAFACLLLILGGGLELTRVPLEVIAPCALILLLQAGDVPDLWFRHLVRSGPTVAARLVVIGLGGIIKVILAHNGAGPAVIAWVIAAETALFVGLLHGLYRRDTAGRHVWRWDRSVALRWARQGWGHTLAAIVGGLSFRFDQLAVMHYLGEQEVGYYFAAMRLLEIPFFFAAAVTAALMPALAAAAQRDDWRARLDLNLRVASLLAWLSAIGATLGGGFAIRLIFGPDYAAAGLVVAIYAWGFLGWFTGLIRVQYLTLWPAPRLHAALAGLTLIVQAAGSLWLVPRWGLAGAAVAFAVTQWLVGLIVPWLTPALRPLARMQTRALFVVWHPRHWPRPSWWPSPPPPSRHE